ncbi:MAG: YDG domain-containing protein [Fibrobacterales bacterium]
MFHSHVFAVCSLNKNSDSEYEIGTYEDLKLIGIGDCSLRDTFRIIADIDASPSQTENCVNNLDCKGFIPIGASSNKFYGTVWGDKHIIWNLYINRPAEDNVGLFGFVGRGGRVLSLGVTGTVTGNKNVGTIAGLNDGWISMTFSSSTVHGNDSYVGGLIGDNSSWVISSYSTGAVTGSASYIGGLVGSNTGALYKTYSSASVARVGTNTGSYYVGGLAGITDFTTVDGYSVGRVGGNTAYYGGSIGQLGPNADVIRIFWSSELSGQNIGNYGSPDPDVIKTDEHRLTLSATYDYWDFGKNWDISETKSYPLLREVYNAPIAFTETMISGDLFSVNQLLINDYSSTPSREMVVKIEDQLGCSQGATGTIDLSGLSQGDTCAVTYRIGEKFSVTDTLWGNSVNSYVIFSQLLFNQIPDQMYGTANTLSLNASNAADAVTPIVFTSSDIGVASISGNEVQVKGAGTTIITATQGALSVTQQLVVYPKLITVNAVAQDREYDGTKFVTVTGVPVGVLPGDDVSWELDTCWLYDKNAERDKNVAIRGSGLVGVDTANYIINQIHSLTVNIYPKPITIDTIEIPEKEYDGTTEAFFTLWDPAFDLMTGIKMNTLLRDNILPELDSALYHDKNVGADKDIDLYIHFGGVDVDNYSFPYPLSVKGTIVPREITAVKLHFEKKVYDGTRNVVYESAEFQNIIPGDILTLDLDTAYMVTKEIHSMTPGICIMEKLILGTLKLSSVDFQNYSIGETPLTYGVCVFPAPLTITANDSVVYGDETITEYSYSYDGIVAGEDESIVKNLVTEIVSENDSQTVVIGSGALAFNYVISYEPGVITRLAGERPYDNPIINNPTDTNQGISHSGSSEQSGKSSDTFELGNSFDSGLGQGLSSNDVSPINIPGNTHDISITHAGIVTHDVKGVVEIYTVVGTKVSSFNVTQNGLYHHTLQPGVYIVKSSKGYQLFNF